MRRVRSLASLAGLVLVAVTSTPAVAGHLVDQKVVLDSGQTTCDYSWRFSEPQFRLDVKCVDEQRSFVFNGRVLYVCGRLGKPQLDFVRSLKVSDPKLTADLAKGVCQEASTDFAVKFYLSPYAAVTAASATGGPTVGFDIQQHDAALTGSVETVQKTKCVDFTRSYKLVARDASRAGDESVNESVCNATSVRWRGNFARELGMRLMRQPGGRRSFQTLTADLRAMAGMPLTVSGKTSGRGLDRKDFGRAYEVSTVAVRDDSPAPAALGLPEGYRIIDLTTLAGVAQAVARLSSHDGATTHPAGDGAPASLDAQDLVRALILGVNPAAGLFAH